MKTSGKIHHIYNEHVISDNFKKREFILEIAQNPQYPQYVKFEFIQDKCDLLDSFEVGQVVDIEFNLNGRLAANKEGINVCYNCLQAWRVKEKQ